MEEFNIIKNDEVRFVCPLYDTVFKRLWDTDLGKRWFTKLVYYLTNINLDEYKEYRQEYATGNKLKDMRVDTVFIKEDSKYTVNIEMYKDYDEEDSFKSRAYVFRILDFAYGKEKNKYTKKYCCQINLNDGYFKYNRDIDILRGEITDRDGKYIFDDLLIVDVFLSKFKDLCYNQVDDEKSAMLSFLRCNSYEEMEVVANGNEEALGLMEELKEMAKGEDFMLYYDVEAESRKRERGKYDLGIEEGMMKEKIEIATNMLKSNYSIDEIAKITGFSLDKIEEIRNTL